ncbi:MAG TPA: glycosyltransferase family 1 protein [Vicinamibacterales bacterium]|nr:glycosyltransferase family 1 protein [Vicinamibacterales bacterium]
MQSTSFRVGIDGRAFSSPAGGVRRYVHELTSACKDVAPDVAFLAIGASAGSLPNTVTGVPARSWLPTNLGWSLDGLPRAIRRAAVDVFHAPAYTAPLWGGHPLVVTSHDVSFERRPEWYPHRDDRIRRWFYRRSACSADVVITDSEFSRQEIEAAYGIGQDRIRVVPLGVSAAFAPAPSPPAVDERVILHVGDLHPRRNVGVLIEALGQLRARSDELKDTVLVLAGADRGSAAAIAKHAAKLGLTGAVRFVSTASDDEVVALMRRASAFTYPSLYEGFGLPPLEAMACGTPVIASSAASIPEVVGDAGLVVDPRDVRGWIEGLVAILGSRERSAQLRAAGLARAAQFTWQRTATQTIDVYRSLRRDGTIG